MIRFVIKTCIAQINKNNYNILYKNNLFNKFFYEFEIKINNNNN